MTQLKTKVEGYYKLEAVNPKGEMRTLSDWFPNLITNTGLDSMNDREYLQNCYIGTDSTTPTFSDTSLGSQVAFTSTVSFENGGVQTSSSPYYIFATITFQFAEGAAAGNLTEIGVGVSGTQLLSRALILDGSGNPTTITILSDEILLATYQFRIRIPETDTTGSVDINGTTHNWTARALEITNTFYWKDILTTDGVGGLQGSINGIVYDGDIGTIFQSPSGASENTDPGEWSKSAYVNGTYEAVFTATLPPSRAVFGAGIGAIQFHIGWCGYQIDFEPKIPKTDQDELTLEFSHSWGRA